MQQMLYMMLQRQVYADTAKRGAGKAEMRIMSQAMKNCKDSSRKISKVALEIAASTENTAAAARDRGEAAGTASLVNAALGATRECVPYLSGS